MLSVVFRWLRLTTHIGDFIGCYRFTNDARKHKWFFNGYSRWFGLLGDILTKKIFTRIDDYLCISKFKLNETVSVENIRMFDKTILISWKNLLQTHSINTYTYTIIQSTNSSKSKQTKKNRASEIKNIESNTSFRDLQSVRISFSLKSVLQIRLCFITLIFRLTRVFDLAVTETKREPEDVQTNGIIW